MTSRGFTLVEVMIALLLLCTGALAGVQVIAAAARAMNVARMQNTATSLASSRIEQFRALEFAFDDTGARVTDVTTNLAASTPGPGGPGLNPSPPGTLDANIADYVDYLDAAGGWIGATSRPPAGAVYVRRWSVDSTGITSDHVVVQVYVAPLAALAGAAGTAAVPGAVRLVTVLPRTQP